MSPRAKTVRRLAFAAVLAVAGAIGGATTLPALAQQTGGVTRDGGAQATGRNPTADSVNEEALFKQNNKIQGVVTIPDWKASVLEQPQGRDWRGFHEGAMPWIAGIAVLGMVVLLALFFFVRGRIRMQPGEITGIKILRFNAAERF